jgi:tight adherence protein B
MRRLLTLPAIAGLLLLAVAGPALAQDDPVERELRIVEIDGTEHPEMGLVVSVPPEMVGTILTEDDFTVTEDDEVRAATVEPVSVEGLQVVLVLDASSSMSGEPIAGAKEAAQGFLDVMPEGVEVAAVSFSSSASVLSDFTTDIGTVAAEVDGIDVGGETALHDGLVTASGLFDESESARRTVVVLSDGGDTVSDASLVDAFEALNAAGVSFIAVELQSPENDSAGLNRLAEETDGEVVPADNPEALASVFDGIAAQIVSRYQITFTSVAYGRTSLVVTAEADGVVATATQGVRYPDPPAPDVTQEEPAPVPTTVVAATPSTLREPTQVQLSWLENAAALWIGAAAVFVAIALLVVFMGVGRRPDVRLVASNVRQAFGQTKKTALSSLAEQATAFAERTVDRRDDSGGLNGRLEQGGVQMRPGEYVVVVVALSLAALTLGLLFGGPLWALVALAAAVGITWLWLQHRITKRQKAFDEQLVDVLQLLAGSIRTGFATMQAIDTVAREMPAPAGEEFQRVKVETQLGRDANESLRAMAKRVGSVDFEWVVEAMEIHREVGGDLADILDSVTATVRDRQLIRRRVQTLSAEGRMTGVVLSLLPFVLLIAVTLLNPAYISELFETGAGQLLLLIGAVAMGTGIFWMRKIVSLEY